MRNLSSWKRPRDLSLVYQLCKKGFQSIPVCRTHEGEDEGEDDRGCPRNYREKTRFFLLSLSLSIVLSTMHYFNMIFIFTLFFSHEFAYIDRSERKIVNVIATWRYERGKRETGRRVSRLSIGGDTVLRYMYVGCNGSSAKSPGSRRKTSPGSSLMD